MTQLNLTVYFSNSHSIGLELCRKLFQILSYYFDKIWEGNGYMI